MNEPNELDEILSYYCYEHTNCGEPECLQAKVNRQAKQAIKALITTHQNQLLDRLLEQSTTYIVRVNQSDGYEVTERAVPVEAIKKMRTK